MVFNVTPFEMRTRILLSRELFGVDDPEPIIEEYRRRLREEKIPAPLYEKITYKVVRR